METTDFLYVDLVKEQKHTPAADLTNMDRNVHCVSSKTSGGVTVGLAAVLTSIPSTSEIPA